MGFKIISAAVTPVGDPDSATATVTIPVPGGAARLLAYDINFTSQPAGTKLTISAEGGTKPIYIKDNANADVPMKQPLEAAVDTVDGSDIADTTKAPNMVSPILFKDITVLIEEGDPVADGVVVRFLLGLL